MDWISEHLWIVGILIVVVGLVVIGFKDTFRFSITRSWAISGVCYDESVRKRVLWIAPLAMLGVIIVSQMQKPFDDQDAIRQTTKFCLFATGLVVAITAIILACTNLPKEIDNRVIYTVVTKPTTRLEIIAGKVMGFARVSALILIIMGVFTLSYLHLRAWVLRRDIAQRLDDNAVDAVSRPTLEHYRQVGLLNARHRVEANGFQMYSREPQKGEATRWMSQTDQDFIIPFDIAPALLVEPNAPSTDPAPGGLVVFLRLDYTQRAPTTQEWQQLNPQQPPTATTSPSAAQLPELIRAAPATGPTTATAPSATDANLAQLPPSERPLPTPQVSINILDGNRNVLVDSRSINGGKPINLPPPGATTPARAYVQPEAALTIASRLQMGNRPEDRQIYVQVAGATPGVQYGAGDQPVTIVAPSIISPGKFFQKFTPAGPALFRGRLGTFGQQLKGADEKEAAVAVYTFNKADLSSADGNTVPLEIRLGIERSSGSNNEETDNPTKLSLIIHNRDTGKTTALDTFSPETNRTSFLAVPRDAVAGGNFDVIVRCLSAEQWIGLRNNSVVLVPSQQAFIVNLVKSLFILWLMSILVVVISIFCSTFLSWPIAIVLTLVLLLGHWGVTQLGDATAPGIGNQVANDLGFRGENVGAKSMVISRTVEGLARGLNFLSAVLPDVSQFSATEDIERGQIIPVNRLVDALKVLIGFGLPIGVLAYVFLKFKEVAP